MRESRAKADRQMERIQSQIDKSQARLEEMDNELLEMRKQTERLEETNRRLEESNRRLGESNKRMEVEFRKNTQVLAEISRQYGKLVEDFVVPSIPRVLEKELGLDVISIAVRVRRKHPTRKDTREYDVIVETPDRVFINSTKNNLSSKDIDDLIDNFHVFREYFPELNHKKMCGIVSTFNPHESQLKYANKKGIVVLGLGHELMELQNPEGFKISDY